MVSQPLWREMDSFEVEKHLNEGPQPQTSTVHLLLQMLHDPLNSSPGEDLLSLVWQVTGEM